MTLTKILCPTDFSSGAARALEVASRLAKDAGADLVIAHTWTVPITVTSGEMLFAAQSLQAMADDAQRGLDEAVATARAAGAPRVSGILQRGVPWSEVTTTLENQGFDLCVIGTHGRTGLARVLLGSVAEKIIRHAPCPVLAVRTDDEIGPFQHVLVPTDFSSSAQRAADLATQFLAPGGTLTLLHVVEAPVSYGGEIMLPEIMRRIDTEAAVALEIEAARLRAPDRTVVTRTRLGYAGAQILSALDDDRSIDLVTVGSHGRTGIARVLMGSVAEKIVRHAHCPVLVSRTRN